jgi:hypothetical protein
LNFTVLEVHNFWFETVSFNLHLNFDFQVGEKTAFEALGPGHLEGSAVKDGRMEGDDILDTDGM